MTNIFEIIDKTGRKIRLTKERWKHIVEEDHRITPKEIEQTIVNPEKINLSDRDESVRWYYSYNKKIKKFLLVSVKYLNDDNFIITAFYTPKIY